MTRILRTRTAVAAVFLVFAAPGRSHSGPEPAALHVRVRGDLASCLRPALDAFAAARSLDVSVEIGVGAPGPEIDVLISSGSDITHALESGRAEEEGALALGKLERSGRTRTVTALALSDAPHPRGAAALLDFLRHSEVREAFKQCLDAGVSTDGHGKRARSTSDVAVADNVPSGQYAKAIVDSWIPRCSQAYNRADYADASHVLGAPDAVKFAKDDYAGIMSLGQGGYVVVDMGRAVPDQPGADVRVYQMTSSEPVTLYGADSPTGPFVLIARQRECGESSTAPIKAGHCDFDLAEGQLTSARYFKIEDGEIYPCLAGGTITEGADIDAIEILTP
jgi:hypothetical protein